VKFDLRYISFANGRVDFLLRSYLPVRSNAERMEPVKLGADVKDLERHKLASDSEYLDSVNFDFETECLEPVANTQYWAINIEKARKSPPWREVPGFGSPNDAEGVSAKSSQASHTNTPESGIALERNLAINKNTADHHGRT